MLTNNLIFPPITQSEGTYWCEICGHPSEDLFSANVHIILRHPDVDKMLKETLDKLPRHYFLVYKAANPEPKPWPVAGWLPQAYQLIEMQDGDPVKLAIPRLSTAGPQAMFMGVAKVILDRLGYKSRLSGLTYQEVVFRELPEDERKLVRLLAGKIFLKLDGRSWCVLPVLEAEEWIVNIRRTLLNYSKP